MAKRIDVKNLDIYYGGLSCRGRCLDDRGAAYGHGVHRPSGCGKSTLLRTLEPDARGHPRCTCQGQRAARRH